MVKKAPRPERSELLMPAGNLLKLKMAVLYGADAVYLGTPDMSLRVKSQFALEDVIEGVRFAHEHGVRVYLTLNLFSHNKDIVKLPTFIETIRQIKPDGVIIADPGVFNFVAMNAPDLELHISTQANVCSWLSVDFWEKQGASLVVMAREVSFEELGEIREKCPDIKLEAFIHGSMCMTYSGRCLLSNFMAERGANQGSCANSCRWNYKVHMKLKDGTIKELELTEENKELFEFFLEEDHRQGELLPIEEDDRGSYILNSKDLCLMPVLDDYLKLGVDSLKVEGRGKSPYYAAAVARAYRMAIDDWYSDPENWSPDIYMEELQSVPSRGYTFAFHEGRLTNHAHNYEHTATIAEFEYAGHIDRVDEEALYVSVKNKLVAGDVLEFLPPKHRDTVMLRLYDYDIVQKNGRPQRPETATEVNAGPQPVIRIPFSSFDRMTPDEVIAMLPPYSIVRKERALTQAEWDRIKLDTAAQRVELGVGSEALYRRRLDTLKDSIDEAKTNLRPKSPRLGVEGCCGRGCNGCLVFWNDPSYAKARELLAKKKSGEMLNTDMHDSKIDAALNRGIEADGQEQKKSA